MVVQEIGGVEVGSEAECAMECFGDPLCNAASYYVDTAELGSAKNCWLKSLPEGTCAMPATTTDNANVIFLLKTCTLSSLCALSAAARQAELSGPYAHCSVRIRCAHSMLRTCKWVQATALWPTPWLLTRPWAQSLL